MRQGTISAGHPVDVATGAVFSVVRDFSLSGRIRVPWVRRYNTGTLDRPSGPLGPGWSARYFATLSRRGLEYQFQSPEGAIELFVDYDQVIDRGAIVRNLASFQELARTAEGYVITRWGEGQEVERFVFRAGASDVPMPLARIENGASAAIDVSHDESGRVALIRQRLERRALQLHYTAEGRVNAVEFIAADGARQLVVRYEYDAVGRLVVAFDALGHADRYEYDASGRIVRETLKDGGVFVFKYDREGRCVRTAGVDGYDEKTFRYHVAIGWTHVTNSLGDTTRYQWLPSGQVITTVDPLGRAEKTEYDEIGRIAATVLAGGETTRYHYDAEGNRAETIDPAGQSWSYTFNARHQPISFSDPIGRTWRRMYDGSGRLLLVEHPAGGRTAFEWDAAGNLTEVRTRRGTFKSFRYDDRGDLIESIDAAGNSTLCKVDAFGRVAEVVNASGQRYRVSYNGLGQTILIEYPDGSTQQFVYNAGGNQTSATDRNGNTRRYRFGPCKRLLEVTNANGDTVRFVWGTEPDRLEAVVNETGDTCRFIYDAAGRLVKQIWFDGHEQTFVRDASGRIVEVQNGLGEVVRFIWDACGRLIERRLPDGAIHRVSYDPSGDLIAAETPDRALRFERDAAGRIVREVQGDHVVENAYDEEGNRIRIATDLDHAVEYVIDNGGHVSAVRLRSGDAFSFMFNERGLEAGRELPGGLRLATEYDASARVTLHNVAAGRRRPAEWTESSRDVVLRRAYEYAPNGTVLSIRDSRRDHWQYNYDAEQRILGAARDGEPRESFQYDAAGNLTEIESFERRDELRYSAGNRLESSGTTQYEFDPQGRLLKRIELGTGTRPAGEWRFTWDALDQLRSVRRPDGAEWRYAYDFFGRRFSKRGPDSETTYIWDRDVVVHVVPERGLREAWVYADSMPDPVAKIVGQDLFSVIPDQVGSPRELLSRIGTIAWSARASVWGRDSGNASNYTDCPIRFPGQWLDEETGLHYNRFRYYDPDTARYISADPIAPRGALNFYRYAPNPLNWLDMLGLDICENRQKGEDFKDGVRDQYPQPPYIVHEEVTVRVTVTDANGNTSTVRTRVDLVVIDPAGPVHYIETKASATAPYTPNQTTAGVGQGAGTLVGPAEIRSDRAGLPPKGSTLPAGTQVQTVRPGDQVPGLPPGTTAAPV